MIRDRRARIVATLGPASCDPEMVQALAVAGADVFRLNFSHGAHSGHQAAFEAVRQAEAVMNRPLGVLADLQGPKLRLGRFANGSIRIAPGHQIRLDLDTTAGDVSRIGMPHPELFRAMKPGSVLLVDDGKVRLRVEEIFSDHALVVVTQGERLSDRKGVALPGSVIPLEALTAKDREDLAFALRLGVDWVALSFVQGPADMAELRRLVDGRAGCLAKIEKPAALLNLDAILDLCDGVMVARGDLGVELEPEEVPVAQKTILRAARARGVPVIVATQMLESMISCSTPTRAETSDVANAVYEGVDALMLSAETASGQFPLEAVRMMNRIAERVERDPRWPELMSAEFGLEETDVDILTAAAGRAGRAGRFACLVVFTSTGATARLLARERPLHIILALTPNPSVARRLALVWGIEPRLAADPDNVDSMTAEAVSSAIRVASAQPSTRILIVAGTPFGAPGSTNLLRIAHVPAAEHYTVRAFGPPGA
jgi:pyruvate kinase